MKKEF